MVVWGTVLQTEGIVDVPECGESCSKSMIGDKVREVPSLDDVGYVRVPKTSPRFNNS